jgi:trk system potassium uptake protein TrkA
MKSILLIGLGRFGKHIALHLNHLGHQVMAVDTSEERVEAVLPLVTNAQIGDSTNADFLESLATMMYALWPSATTFKVHWKQLLCSVN